MFFFVFFVAILVVYIARYYIKYNDVVNRTKHIPGLPLVPFFGNALHFINKSSVEITEKQMKFGDTFGDFIKVVIGTQVNILLGNPKDIEVLLTSQDLIDKTSEYDAAQEIFGEGLIFSTGKKWFTRRRLITPAFHFKILDQFVEVFDKNSKILVKELEKYVGETVDIYPKVALCALDVICETSMGVKINSQINSNSPYVNAIKELTCIMNQRSFNIFYRNPTIFHLTPKGFRMRQLLKITHGFTDKVIKQRRKELTETSTISSQNSSIEDDVGAKKKMALLDILLKSTADGKPLTNAEIREEVDTFAFAGHDTTSSAMAFCCFTIAKHPEVQQKVFEEIRSVIGDDKEQQMTINDLNNLNYLERVVKETLRMYPPVATFGRRIKEDVIINGKLLPKDTSVFIAPNIMGRSEKIWENPKEFDPNRFKDTSNMHAFSNVVFSAGSRNCIGQKFAMLEIKSTISKIIRNFELSVAIGYDLRLYLELILKSEGGVQIYLRPRKYE